jgi:hypothetical protein
MYRKAMTVHSLYSYRYLNSLTLCHSYYFLYSLFNKIRHKGKILSAWKQGDRRGEGGGVVVKGGCRWKGEEMTQTNMHT